MNKIIIQNGLFWHNREFPIFYTCDCSIMIFIHVTSTVEDVYENKNEIIQKKILIEMSKFVSSVQ